MKTKQSFAEQITNYESFLKEDYKRSTIKSYSKAVLHYLEWKNSGNANQTASIELSMVDYINPNNPINNRMKDIKSVRAAMYLFYYQLTGTKFQAVQHAVRNTSLDNEVDAYILYLKEIAGLAEATKISHQRYINRFLFYIFPKQEIEPSLISASIVQNFLAAELRHLKPTSKKVVIGIIRSYVRYLQFKGGELDSGLLALSLNAPVWKLSSIPKTFEKEDIANIHSSYDLNTLVGIRDYAIALCFTEFGLRVSEVAHITLDDFNWREGKIRIKKTKTHMERDLPLSKNVGEAVVKYLKISRPETAERILFVRFSHHCGHAMGSEQIRGTIRRAYERVGISSTITGTHILRHSKAKSLYESGSSLKIIADILGHESIDTTVIYTKVGRSALHCVTCSWPLALASEVVDHESRT